MSKHDWFKEAEKLFRSYTKRRDFVTGEDFRLYCEQRNLLEGSNSHWWGNLINNARRHGWIVDTGRVERMRAIRSNGRRTPIWRVV